jgi:hypothetical protein
MRWAPSPIDGGMRKWALIARKAHVSFVKICLPTMEDPKLLVVLKLPSKYFCVMLFKI